MAFAFLIDFDGTACPSDVGASFSRRFARAGGTGRDEALRRWQAGEIGSRELTVTECRDLEVTEEQALEFGRGFELDPGFGPFVNRALERGHEVMVVSEGFDFYIHALLRRAGLSHLRVTSNRLRFDGGRAIPEFPHASDACPSCGNCKGERVREHRARGHEVALIGDGLSDRCGARAADHVVARRDLLAFCGREGIAATPFEDFRDVARWAARLDPALGAGVGAA